MPWNYKILVTITTPQGGVATTLCHYQEHDVAEEAYKELELAPETPLFKMSAVRLYSIPKKYGRYGR